MEELQHNLLLITTLSITDSYLLRTVIMQNVLFLSDKTTSKDQMPHAMEHIRR